MCCLRFGFCVHAGIPGEAFFNQLAVVNIKAEPEYRKLTNTNINIPFFLASGNPMLSTVISEFITSCHVVCDGQPYFRPSGVLNVYSNNISCY